MANVGDIRTGRYDRVAELVDVIIVELVKLIEQLVFVFIVEQLVFRIFQQLVFVFIFELKQCLERNYYAGGSGR
jgi:hypothetical protein